MWDNFKPNLKELIVDVTSNSDDSGGTNSRFVTAYT